MEERQRIDETYEYGRMKGERDLLCKIVEQLLKIEIDPKYSYKSI